jgi:hypothetical protein
MAAAIANTHQRQNDLFSMMTNSFTCDRQKAAAAIAPETE